MRSRPSEFQIQLIRPLMMFIAQSSMKPNAAARPRRMPAMEKQMRGMHACVQQQFQLLHPRQNQSDHEQQLHQQTRQQHPPPKQVSQFRTLSIWRQCFRIQIASVIEPRTARQQSPCSHAGDPMCSPLKCPWLAPFAALAQ